MNTFQEPAFFQLFGVLFVALFIGAFLFMIIKGVSTWTANNNAEVLSKRCKAVDKRTQVWGGSGDSSASTNYYL